MSSFQKASQSIDVLTLNKAATGTLAEGAVCKIDTDYDSVGQCSGAAAKGLLGIITNAGGVISGDRANVQVLGQANVLIAASTTVAVGDKLISAAAAGTLKPWTTETDVDVIAICLEARTVGSAAELVPALIVHMYLPA